MNLGLLAETEQAALLETFGRFCNALDFPIQLVIRTRRWPVDAQLKRLREQLLSLDKPLQQVGRAYMDHLSSLIAERQLLSREALVVLPYRGQVVDKEEAEGWEAAGQWLAERSRMAAEYLRRCGCAVELCTPSSLREILYQVFNPRLAEIQPMVSDAVPIGDGEDAWRAWFAPAGVAIEPSQGRLDDGYWRTLAISAYPRIVTPGWLAPLFALPASADIALHITPVPGPTIASFLRRKVSELASSEAADAERQRLPDPERQAALADARDLQEKLARGEERLFTLGIYVTLRAATQEELETVTTRCEATLGGLLAASRRMWFRQWDGYCTTAPTGDDRLQVLRHADTSSLVTCFPFGQADLADPEGCCYGINPQTRGLVVLDRFALENYNAVVFAKSGAGKSYAVKLELLRWLVAGVEAYVIDPEDEYVRLADSVGGTIIRWGPTSAERFNPFAITAGSEAGARTRKVLSLQALWRLMAGDLSPELSTALDRALLSVFAAAGITDDPATYANVAPTFADLQVEFRRRMEDAEPEDRASWRTLHDRLLRYTDGPLAPLFTTPSRVQPKRPLTVFALRECEGDLRRIGMFLALDHCWQQIKGSRHQRRRLVILDEAWWLMQEPEAARYVYRLAKTARKYWVALTAISQDAKDFLSSDYGQAVVANASLALLFKQAPQALDQVAAAFRLSEGERRLLLTAAVGEGLCIAGQVHIPLQVVASPAEHRLITTDPEELAAMAREGV